MANPMLPRGLRNNNPLNIRRSANKWKGKLVDGKDPDFETFSSIEFGIRAAVVIMRTYIRKYHADTPRLIIRRWAPPAENNTENYLRLVVRQSGILADEKINPEDLGKISRLLQAMAYVECGRVVSPVAFAKALLLL